MIITQTPFRVSFAGGGTDLPAFYEKEHGAVLSVGINHHMYVTVSPRFEETTRIAYSQVEIANDIEKIEHTIAREAIRLTGLSNSRLEITTVGDVPAGTGLGSSSSFAVGLLNALYAYRGCVTSPSKLGKEACTIEIDVLKKPIGRQDQYAAAYGGVNFIRFNSNHTVDVEPVATTADFLNELERHTLLLYTEQQRDADQILRKQSEGSSKKIAVLRQMRELAYEMRLTMGNGGDLRAFGELLHQGWELKRSLGFGISNEAVDDWYQVARSMGALGGKLLGAGGGGFLLVMAPPESHDSIREACGRPKELRFTIDRRGSRVIFISDRYSF